MQENHQRKVQEERAIKRKLEHEHMIKQKKVAGNNNMYT